MDLTEPTLQHLSQVKSADGKYVSDDNNWLLLTSDTTSDVEILSIPGMVNSACVLALTGWELKR